METKTLNLRGLNTRLTQWGDPTKPLLLLLHGWMDCGGSFQFVASELEQDFYILAPDLRGFGETDHAPGGYWFPDYLADVEALLNVVSPTKPVLMAGHSMGGNIAMLYAGISPHRVEKVMSLESVGLPTTDPTEAPAKYRKWLMEVLADEQARIYPSKEALLMSMHRANPQLAPSMIEVLADLWAMPLAQGGYALKHDHAHRYTNPYRYNYDDIKAIWAQISAPVGLAMATASPMYQRIGRDGRIDEIKQLLNIGDQAYFELEGAGHMIHLERPQETAQILSRFFGA